MNKKLLLFSGIGISILAILIVAAIIVSPFPFNWGNGTPSPMSRITQGEVPTNWDLAPQGESDQIVRQAEVPTLTPAQQTTLDLSAFTQTSVQQVGAQQELSATSNLLTQRYAEVNPGVVNITVLVNVGGSQGAGAGSGFVLDEDGHIVTNNHVVDQATEVVVNFFNGLQAEAMIIGTDDDSDLAIIKVDTLPDDVHPLAVADSDLVQVGNWAIAIGNPFGLGTSMTLGIVSAIGRSIPSGATPFAIPQAIQTDAAINPGNSGGPLLNLAGQVIGVNAQIRTNGSDSNTGVGFAIPANVVRHIAPVLIRNGAYDWPWLGVEGAPVGLTLMEANNLETQQGAYIVSVVPGGPADEAGLQGAELVQQDGLRIPMGGDVVIAIDGEAVQDFEDLTNQIAFKTPGEEVVLHLIRDGQEEELSVTLEARPSDFGQSSG